MTENYRHGQVEASRCSVIDNLGFLDNTHKWKDLTSIVKIESKFYFRKTSQGLGAIRTFKYLMRITQKNLKK